jgi:hypothetical protein
MYMMKSTSMLQQPIKPLNQQGNEHFHDENGTESELAEALQVKRQQLDISLEEVIERLAETQQLLNGLKVICFSVSTPFITPTAKLKVQRTSHHCNRLLTEVQRLSHDCTRLSTEVQQLLQPFSHDLLTLLSLEPPPFPAKAHPSVGETE